MIYFYEANHRFKRKKARTNKGSSKAAFVKDMIDIKFLRKNVIFIKLTGKSARFYIIKGSKNDKIEYYQRNDKCIDHIFNPSRDHIHCIRNYYI